MNFRNLITFCLLVAFCFSVVSAEGKWVSLDGTSTKPTPIKVKVLEQTENQVKLELVVAGYFEKLVKIGEQEVVVLHIPHAAQMMEIKGFPMLPKFATLVKIHDRAGVKLTVDEKEEVEKDLTVPVIPARGHFNRNIDPSTVPFKFGPVYKENVFWPAAEKQFSIGKAFLLRDQRGVRLQVLPITANHVQMKMKVVKKAVVTLTCEGEGENVAPIARGQRRAAKTFRKMYANSFVNYTEEQVRGLEENNKKLVVVVPTQFEASVKTWVEWKQKCGYKVTVKSVADGTVAGDIKKYLQGLYDNAETRFGYVVLIGDASNTSNFEQAKPMPTFKGSKEGAAADRVYVRLAGNDNYPDAFVSRISATTAEGVAAQLAKIVKYEQTAAGDWANKGICIASSEGSPADYTRAEWLQNGGSVGQKVTVEAGGLLKAGYSSFDDIYDPSASASQVANSINAGRGVICYIGHGSSTSWASSGFGVSHIKKLTNGAMLPVIWSVACVNGDFVKTAECFAEAWLRQVDGGAAAIEAASTNESWVPPCDKQAATVNAIIKKQHQTFGALEGAGIMAALKAWGDTNSSEGNKMAEQCNLFGDCTMIVKLGKARDIQVNNYRSADNGISFQISSENRGVENVTVTVYNEDMSFVASADTDEQGSVQLSLENASGKLFYTVVGQDVVPQVDVVVE
ncbi:MAG: hypothetical protein HUU50_08545 [Candidatus Brocadiae bacterium]|nr:hypothetical protein [Candidatus Brocadiia bacterium]